MLNERKSLILRLIVEAYVQEGRPVSSRSLKEVAGLSESTATIRNVMAELERAGYLTKPYTSAGRIPTDDGYRQYVDGLEESPQYTEAFSSRFRSEIREHAVDVESVMESATRILGRLSRNFAVLYGSAEPDCRVTGIRLIELDPLRIMVVVNLSPEHERTTVVRMEREVCKDVVARAEDLVNRAVENRTPDEAREALGSVIRDNMTDEGILTREIAMRREEIFSEPPAVQLYFEERGHLMEQPEFSDPRLLQLLLRLLHNKDYLTSVLSDRTDETTRITIGREHSDRELQPFSLVTAGYRMGGARGVLGVIGPTRMRYDLACTLVGCAARELRAFGEEYLVR